jgi:hypothetical protein
MLTVHIRVGDLVTKFLVHQCRETLCFSGVFVFVS